MWEEIQTKEQLNQIIDSSNQHDVLLYKHSTRCSLSSMAKNRLESNFDLLKKKNIQLYILDLIRYRDIANLIEETLKVRHESPQVILLKNGKVVKHESHNRINANDIVSWVE